MNPNNLMDMYNQMCGNPIQFLSKRFNIPQDINISDTEFGKMIAGMDVVVLLSIMDELMDTLKVVSPRIYDGVMRKLKK